MILESTESKCREDNTGVMGSGLLVPLILQKFCRWKKDVHVWIICLKREMLVK